MKRISPKAVAAQMLKEHKSLVACGTGRDFIRRMTEAYLFIAGRLPPWCQGFRGPGGEIRIIKREESWRLHVRTAITKAEEKS